MNLQLAANIGDLETVKKLVESGAYIRTESDLALQWAAEKGHLDVVILLIELASDIHVINYALQWAALSGHLDVVRFLIGSGANIHEIDDSALQVAAENGHIDVVRFLIVSGADFLKHQPEMEKLLGVDDLPESKEEIIGLLNAAIIINK